MSSDPKVVPFFKGKVNAKYANVPDSLKCIPWDMVRIKFDFILKKCQHLYRHDKATKSPSKRALYL